MGWRPHELARMGRSGHGTPSLPDRTRLRKQGGMLPCRPGVPLCNLGPLNYHSRREILQSWRRATASTSRARSSCAAGSTTARQPQPYFGSTHPKRSEAPCQDVDERLRSAACVITGTQYSRAPNLCPVVAVKEDVITSPEETGRTWIAMRLNCGRSGFSISPQRRSHPGAIPLITAARGRL